MLALLNQLPTRPIQNSREFLTRLVTFILVGNTDANFKKWALLYPDGREPKLVPLYDPMCVSSFLNSVSPQTCAINRRLDEKLRAFNWAKFRALMEDTKLLRPFLMKHYRNLVKQAKADWPRILESAPESIRASVNERLSGNVALAN